MNRLQAQVAKAAHSPFQLWLLNTFLLRTVPFNKPHALKVTAIKGDSISITARNIRRNQNHIKGIHACVLATLCEYVSGLSLLIKLDPRQYRIILKNIAMDYHYQAMDSATVTFSMSEEELQQLVLDPLKTEEKIFREFEVKAYDATGNHVCTGRINWQVKSWKNVKTPK